MYYTHVVVRYTHVCVYSLAWKIEELRAARGSDRRERALNELDAGQSSTRVYRCRGNTKKVGVIKKKLQSFVITMEENL